VIGVHTGEVFGDYSYGRALGLTLLDTPLLIGLNWLMLTYCVFAIMESTKLFLPLKALLAAMLMVVYDIVMEPVAIRIDMWSWGEGPIPLQNYQAWFIISLVFLVAMHLAGIKTKNRVAPWLFGTQFVFFSLLNLSLRLF
jgi:bisanhydrobacterioruberin hydratase